MSLRTVLLIIAIHTVWMEGQEDTRRSHTDVLE